MEIDKLKEETAVYRECLRLRPLLWFAFEPMRIYEMEGGLVLCRGDRLEGREVAGYCYSVPGMGSSDAGKPVTQDGLPTEFFNHQLRDLDVSDEQKLFEFLAEWGFPYSIMRYSTALLEHTPSPEEQEMWERGDLDLRARERKLDEIGKRNKRAIKTTDSLWKRCERKDYKRGPIILHELVSRNEWEKSRPEFEPAHPLVVISRDEVVKGIETLRWAVDSIIDCEVNGVQADAPAPQYELINGAVCPSVMLSTKHETAMRLSGKLASSENEKTNPLDFQSIFGTRITSPEGLVACNLLTRAVCNQFFDVVSSNVPWRACAREECVRVFKYQQKKGTKKPNSRSIYCSERCYNTQNTRNKRAAKRIDHGIERRKAGPKPKRGASDAPRSSKPTDADKRR